MNPQPESKRSLWLSAFRQRNVWTRAAKIGLPIGCAQSLINQGDVWWQHQATGLTLAKTIVSPLVTFSVALVSAAATWVEKRRQSDAVDTSVPRSFSGAVSFTEGTHSSVPKHEIVQI